MLTFVRCSNFYLSVEIPKSLLALSNAIIKDAVQSGEEFRMKWLDTLVYIETAMFVPHLSCLKCINKIDGILASFLFL